MKHSPIVLLLVAVVLGSLGTGWMFLKFQENSILQQRVQIEQQKWQQEQAERSKQEAKEQEAARQKAAYDAKRAYDSTPAGKAANLKKRRRIVKSSIHR